LKVTLLMWIERTETMQFLYFKTIILCTLMIHLFESWLRKDYRSHQTLFGHVKNALINKTKNEVQTTLNGMDTYNFDFETPNKLTLENSYDDCVWVPAVFNKSQNYRIYGGVNLQTQLRSNQVNSGRNYTIYSAQVLIRSAQHANDKGHNFPGSFDQHIIRNGDMQTTSNNAKNRQNLGSNYVVYSSPGTMNGRSGVYEIGAIPITTSKGNQINLVTHRVFRAVK
jgi:hypothetical protein